MSVEAALTTLIILTVINILIGGVSAVSLLQMANVQKALSDNLQKLSEAIQAQTRLLEFLNKRPG